MLIKKWNSISGFWLFAIICFSYILIAEFSKYLLGINELLIKEISETISLKAVEEFFTNYRKWHFLGYVLLPLFTFIKNILVSFCINLGLFFFERNLRFKEIFKIALTGEICFIFFSLVKTFWIYFFLDDYSLQDIQNFYPLSLAQVLNTNDIAAYFLYPLQTINAFEAIYWIVLALLLDQKLNINEGNLGIKIVASSYGPGLLIWIVFVMFLSLNMS